MNKKRFRTPPDKLPPRTAQPELFPKEIWDGFEVNFPRFDSQEDWDQVCPVGALAEKVRVALPTPLAHQPGRKGWREPRAYLAAALMKSWFEWWTGQTIGRQDGPFSRSLQRLLDELGCKTKASTIIIKLKEEEVGRSRNERKTRKNKVPLRNSYT